MIAKSLERERPLAAHKYAPGQSVIYKPLNMRAWVLNHEQLRGATRKPSYEIRLTSGFKLHRVAETLIEEIHEKRGSSSPPEDTAKRIVVTGSQPPRQPVKVTFIDDVVPVETRPTLYAWPSAFWFVRGGWPMFLPSASPYRM